MRADPCSAEPCSLARTCPTPAVSALPLTLHDETHSFASVDASCSSHIETVGRGGEAGHPPSIHWLGGDLRMWVPSTRLDLRRADAAPTSRMGSLWIARRAAEEMLTARNWR